MTAFLGLVLSHGDLKTDWYTKHVLGGIGLFEPLRDSIPFEAAIDLVKRHSQDEVLTHGSSAKRFLATYVNNVRDISASVCVSGEIPLLCHLRHKPRYCSKSKSAVIVNQLMEMDRL